MYSIGWFTTAKGQGSRNLLSAVQDRIARGEIDAKIEFVFLSREPGESPETDKFIDLANSYGIPLVCFSYKKYREFRGAQKGTKVDDLPDWRLDYDREVIKRLSAFPHPELSVMAGYMLVVGPELCGQYNIINLHPAAPGGPAGTWQEVIWKLIDQRAEASGVMMHLVTPELDKGPVVSYCRYPVRGPAFDALWGKIDGKTSIEIKSEDGEANPLFREIRRHGASRELPLIGNTVKAFSSGRVSIKNGVIVDCSGKAIGGYDLTTEIDAEVQNIL
ncbi:Folate-dependent phosphoribosylglycinamide formyltransferase PurN [Dehalogenimonas formicexedens]|uniref:phosphoribosylglycinamide formyltransferase 1 n=1 Tax=Dehalogenimonas formicexedens TaxID=1839801 RepID=A0A1P8F6K5_9CHLR|nr:formyltransferase family protein [Dehalogenimonas formicexedens]APV44114.1 Folate-dependent phosphoribosylglycinamide formyltransferase PurN [Dehalogenimonas formicexedens]